MSLRKIIKTIKDHDKFLVSTHVHPDPDALSSQLATALFLKALGKTVCVLNSDEIPARFDFLPKFNMLKTLRDGQQVDFEVLIVLDCGDIGRIDRIQSLIKDNHIVLNIDHHITNTVFGHLNYVEPLASSTAEVIFKLFKEAKVPLTKDIAILLYMGIMTDTGSFRYDSTTSFTHAVAGELMKFDFSVSDLYRKMYERIPFDDLKAFAKMITRFEKLYDGRVVCVEMKKKVLDSFSPEFDVKDKIFTFLRALKGVEVIIILTENEKNVTRVNLRSQGNTVNVSELASFFKGGGHRKASGCMVPEKMSSAKARILKQLEKML